MNKATLTGFIAVAAWALLALLTDLSGSVPPLQLLAITFAIGAIPGAIAMLVQPARRAALHCRSCTTPAAASPSAPSSTCRTGRRGTA